LLVIPVNLAQINRTLYEPRPSTYGEFVWQGAYIFNVTLSGGFELRGNVTHIEPQTASEGANQLTNSSYWITRTLYIDNTLYTISDEMVKLNSLDNLAPVTKVNLK
jgi:inhibitor of cysteine peptidase